MIHTILSHGREETNIIFNYLNPSLMTHISLEHFQNQLLFSSNKQQLPIQKNKQHWQTRLQQNHSTIRELVKRKELEGFLPLHLLPKHKKLSGSISASQGQKAHRLPTANYVDLSLILAYLQESAWICCYNKQCITCLISAILAGFYLSPCFAWTHSCVISAAKTNKTLIQSQKQEDTTN